MQQTFQRTLPEEKTIYIVITSNGCPTCKTSLLHYLQTQTHCMQLVVVQNWGIALPDNIEIMYDEEKKINRLDMRISGTYVLFIKNHKIVDNFSVTPPGITLLDEKIDEFLSTK